MVAGSRAPLAFARTVMDSLVRARLGVVMYAMSLEEDVAVPWDQFEDAPAFAVVPKCPGSISCDACALNNADVICASGIARVCLRCAYDDPRDLYRILGARSVLLCGHLAGYEARGCEPCLAVSRVTGRCGLCQSNGEGVACDACRALLCGGCWKGLTKAAATGARCPFCRARWP